MLLLTMVRSICFVMNPIRPGPRKTSPVIDELIHDITTENNMTTIINTHDMNSVMGIGDSILYIYQGHKEWEGTKDDVSLQPPMRTAE